MRLDQLDVRVVRNWIPYRRFRFDPFAPAVLHDLHWADIVHVHQQEKMMSTLAILHAMVARRRIFASHLGGSGYGLHKFIDIDRFFDGHLHISAFSRRHFGHETRSGAHTILGGADVVAFRPSIEPVEREGVVFVGRLLPHKGINYLIEAIDPDIPLTIVGHRWRHAAKFDALLMTLAKGKNVRFVEGEPQRAGAWQPHAEDPHLAHILQRAMCIVLPSVHTTIFGEQYRIPELLGLVVIEGMACGAPAIVTDVCSLPEVVVDGVTGFVVPPNDSGALRAKIRWLHNHPEAARRMGEAARKRVLDVFTWDRVVDRCLEAYGVSSA
jgi:glycosyltransferase involved in cell wall biosynthesis